jgi:hypothetical protein
MEIEPDVSPLLTETLVNYHMDGMPGNHTFDFMLDLWSSYDCLRVESLLPGSFLCDYLCDKQVEGLFLIAFNSIELHSLMDITAILDDMYNQPDLMPHTIMTGFMFLFGELDTSDANIDQLSTEEHYHMVSHSVFSLCLEAVTDDDDDDDIQISNNLAYLFLDI